LSKITDIHSISGLFKTYFRELSDPLLTYESYDMFITADTIPEEEARIIMIKKLLTKFLPQQNCLLLKKLCCLLNKVVKFQDENMMGIKKK
jgi:hypothetical protein